MLDRYGRNITYLRLSVTELCNLRCRYCMPEEGVCKKEHDEMLTEEEIVLAVETAAELGINKLRITGGEPLVKKNIVSICERTAAVPGIREVCITTNGVLLPKLARPLKDAGVRRLNISLDTLDAAKFRYITRLGSLDEVLRGVETALETGFEKIKLNAVLIGGFNEDEIAPLAGLTKRWPVDLRFIELMPMLDRRPSSPASGCCRRCRSWKSRNATAAWPGFTACRAHRGGSASSARCRATSAANATASASRRTASSSPACTARRSSRSRVSTARACASSSARRCSPSPNGTASCHTPAALRRDGT